MCDDVIVVKLRNVLRRYKNLTDKLHSLVYRGTQNEIHKYTLLVVFNVNEYIYPYERRNKIQNNTREK